MLQRALGQCRDSMQTDDGHIIRLNAPTRDFSFLFLPPGSNGDPNFYNGEEFVCMCGARVQCVLLCDGPPCRNAERVCGGQISSLEKFIWSLHANYGAACSSRRRTDARSITLRRRRKSRILQEINLSPNF